jgi:hypothetical protein
MHQKISGLLAFGILFFFCNVLKAQTGKGYLLIAVKPKDAIIRIDTALYQQTWKHIEIDSGHYVIQAWAPHKKLLTDTVYIKEKRGVVFRHRLENTEAYKDYLATKHLQNGLKFIPGVATICAGLIYLGAYQTHQNNADEYLEKANASKATYESMTDINDMQQVKEDFYKYKTLYEDALNKSEKIAKQASIVIPAGVILSGALFYYASKFMHPVYTETPLLSGLSVNYELTGQLPGPRVNCSLKF